MNIILLGYNGLIGSYILKDLVEQVQRLPNLKIICVGRNNKNQPFKIKEVKYEKWDFLTFSKSKLFFFENENIIINCVGKNQGNLKNLRENNLIFIEKLLNYLNENKLSTHLIHLGSVSVYGIEKNDIGSVKNVTEKSEVKFSDFYSKSKLEADNTIQNFQKINENKLSYTILRIANVISYSKKSSAYRLIEFLLKKGFWFKFSDNTNYHFIHVKDVASAVTLCIFNLNIAKNKIYIVSDDNNQFNLHKVYSNAYNSKLHIIPIPARLVKLIIKYFFLPKKLLNFFLTISSEIYYNNEKIKKELNFKTNYSLKDKIT